MKTWQWAGTYLSLKGYALRQGLGVPDLWNRRWDCSMGSGVQWQDGAPLSRQKAGPLWLRTQGRVFLLSSSALPSCSGCPVSKVAWARWGRTGRRNWPPPGRGVGDSWWRGVLVYSSFGLLPCPGSVWFWQVFIGKPKQRLKVIMRKIKWVVVYLVSLVRLFSTPWIAACRASLSFTI